MSDKQQPEVFRFKRLMFWVIYLMVVGVPLGVFLLISAISSGAFSIWFLFVLAFIFIWVMFPYLLIRNDSDVEIGNGFIRRRFFGKITQSLSWDNIKEVRVIRVPTKDHPNRVAINFMPNVVPRLSLTRTGRIIFTTMPLRTGNLSDLLDLVNQKIALHDIKVAWWDGGIEKYTDHVEWPLPGSKWAERKERR